MKTLAEIYENYKGPASYGDKGTIHSYIEVYEALLANYRLSSKTVLEIGIMSGHSLRMWEEYFPNAKVIGVDLSDRPLGGMADLRPIMAEGNHNIVLMDAVDPFQVKKNFGDCRFDVIIEDASHILEHQLGIYDNFKNLMVPDGLYIIEDVDKLDEVRPLFEKIDAARPVSILDRRPIKGRFDDVLVVIGGDRS